ncbi:hypothetical protein VNO78_19284 [Psophocarpus tetragonolobus]|uniref:Gnk2-homologous domain-containing protein n=1 Tax=Psophocarpus tetragonolobus TaxID=3891 RepID=A0AAN9S811_PSOTE
MYEIIVDATAAIILLNISSAQPYGVYFVTVLAIGEIVETIIVFSVRNYLVILGACLRYDNQKENLLTEICITKYTPTGLCSGDLKPDGCLRSLNDTRATLAHLGLGLTLYILEPSQKEKSNFIICKAWFVTCESRRKITMAAATLSFVFCLFVIIIWHVSAQTCDNSRGNYTVNSTYHNNLNTLLSSFSSHTEIKYGFYNFSYGEDPDKVYAIGVCRGDQNQDECLKCLNDSRVALAQKCPNQKEAIHWPGECVLRYSYRSIFGLMENQPTILLVYEKNVTGSVDEFNKVLESLMRNLSMTAASGDSRRKYATDSRPTPDFQTTYGYVQCTPDLSSEDCTKCLGEAISNIPVFNGKAGGNVLKPSCRIRFDPYAFYKSTVKLDPDAPPTTTPLPSPSTYDTSSPGKSNTSRTIIAIVVPVASVVLVLILFCIYLRVRKPTKELEMKTEEDSYEDEITFAESLQFHFDTIRVATNEFADSNKLGQGGFGAVYRGQLSNGQVIAVKSGYMAPEYALYGQFSAKSDVFSFGVLVLQIVSGLKNSVIRHGDNVKDLLSFAWQNWREGSITNIVDSILNNGSQNEIMRCIHIGLLCVQEDAVARPSMTSIALMLNSNSLTLQVPSKPAFVVNSRTTSFPDMLSSEHNSRETRSSESKNKSARNSINEASITELYPR